MPMPGADATNALPLTRRLLGDEAPNGTLLFVNDGFSDADLPALESFAADETAPSVVALVVGSSDSSPSLPGDAIVDEAVLSRAERDGGVTVVRMQNGDGDLRALMRAVASRLAAADDPDAEWQDQGWWFLWPAMLLALVWFRRGWTMQW